MRGAFLQGLLVEIPLVQVIVINLTAILPVIVVIFGQIIQIVTTSPVLACTAWSVCFQVQYWPHFELPWDSLLGGPSVFYYFQT